MKKTIKLNRKSKTRQARAIKAINASMQKAVVKMFLASVAIAIFGLASLVTSALFFLRFG